ncbi:unnamed protein product [Diamesa serratosioi]
MDQIKEINRGSNDSINEVLPKDKNRGSYNSIYEVLPNLKEIKKRNRETINSIKETIVKSQKIRQASKELDERISLLLKGYTFLMPPEYYEPIIELGEPVNITNEPVMINKKRGSANSSEKKRSFSYKPISITEMLNKNLTANDDLQKKVQKSSIISKEDERFVLEDSNIIKKPLTLEGITQSIGSRRRNSPRSIPSKDARYL